MIRTACSSCEQSATSFAHSFVIPSGNWDIYSDRDKGGVSGTGVVVDCVVVALNDGPAGGVVGSEGFEPNKPVPAAGAICGVTIAEEGDAAGG